MSTNKNALIRYQTLDRCFRNTGRMYFLEDLLEACNEALVAFDPSSDGIQRRQLFHDIRFMQSEQGWSVPLDKNQHGRRTFYRYRDPSFSINHQPLHESEIAQIKSALQILTRFTGTPQFEWIHEMIPMLESKLGLIARKNEVIGFESNIDLEGLHFLTPLFHAIVNERVLKVSYQDFKSAKPYLITFHPHFLKQYNNRWFALGLNAEIQKPTWNLALDRIESLTETAMKYQPSDMDWQAYFYDVVGVTRPEDTATQEVVLRFSPEVTPYVMTKPIHPSQKHKQDATGLEVRIDVIPNYELEQLILSFAEKVTVISPPSFKAHMAHRLHAAAQLYGSF